jgi:Cys-rich repeat protein
MGTAWREYHIRGLALLLVVGLAGCGGKATSTPSIVGGGDSWVSTGDSVASSDLNMPVDVPTEACSSDKECGDYYCEVGTSTCVECLINSHCAPGYRCEANSCIPKDGGCNSDAECTVAGLICDEEIGECVECVESADCPTGQYCLEGKCLDWICTPDARWCKGTVATLCNEDGSAIAIEEECDDQSLCTVGDACVNGECVLGSEKDCDDHNGCTIDDCDGETGCFYQSEDGECDDGTDCTEGDHCEAGQCVPGELVCACVNDGGCFELNDDDLCNGSLHCVDGKCIIDPQSKVVCEASDDPCLAYVCDGESGECLEETAGEGDECDDGDACTADDSCWEGQCVGVVEDCDDGNPCTIDNCSTEFGCLYNPVGSESCDDGNKCTNPDTCMDGVCIGQSIDCEDGNPCTENSCLPASGCQSAELDGACEDGDLCTTGDQCVDAVCKGTELICVEDGNPCTNDFCDPAAGCVHEPNDLPCDDDNECTLADHCVAGECVPGELLYECDDENPCTTDSCNADSGACIYTNNAQPCDDGDLCTDGDQCANSICVSGTPKDCDDDNGCTEDVCNELGQCKNTPVSASCEDGNACTVNDKCVVGACQPGQPLKCNDQNGCTDDSCDPVEGCVYAPNQAICSDNNACTVGDGCADGQCVGGESLDCEDDNLCTADSCDPDGGCVNLPTSDPCDDSNACTKGDYCAAGICIAGPAVTCNDDNECTDDSCDADSGCVHTPNEDSCEDGNACTFGDQCNGGQCGAGELNDCNDGNVCTADVCDFDTCLNPAQDGVCDDDDPCTVADSCGGGLCAGQPVANCGCGSLGLDGQSGHGVVPASAGHDVPVTFTIETWFKQNPVALDGGPKALLCKWRSPSSDGRSFCLQAQGANNLVFTVYGTTADGNENFGVTAEKVPLDGAWHHVAAVYDSSQLRLYVDGKLADTKSAVFQPVAANVPLFIGGRWDTSAEVVNRFFNGNLDEIRLSSAALYSGDTFEPKSWLSVQLNTVAYWGADQGQFMHLFDLGGKALHAKLKGATSWSSDTPADVCVPKPNYPPSAPVVSISPPNPQVADDLTCVIDEESVDIESDPLTYGYAWFKDGVLQPAYTAAVLPASATAKCPDWNCAGCQTWTCRVTPADPKPGPHADASKTVGAATCEDCEGQVWQNHCYKLGSGMSWGDAKASCQGFGGFLVTIDSDAENNYVDGLCSGTCWIGLSDVAQEGTWTWHSGTPYNPATAKWRWGQPNDGGWLGSQDCGLMCEDCGWNQPSGLWDDAGCDGTRAYVCEKAPK